MGSHLARVLDDLHVLLTELVGVELQEPLGDLRQRGELGLLVDVLLSVFILKEALRRKRRRKSSEEREATWSPVASSQSLKKCNPCFIAFAIFRLISFFEYEKRPNF